MMILQQAGVAVLLGAVVASAWLSALGMLVMRGTFSRLHYVGLAAVLVPVLAALAIVLDAASLQTSIKAIGAALILIATNPAVTHATARAVFVREVKSRQPPAAHEQKGRSQRA